MGRPTAGEEKCKLGFSTLTVTCGEEQMMSDEGENGYRSCPRRGTKSSKATLTTPVIVART